MPDLIHGETRIPYEVVVSKRRATIGIQVCPDKRVVVRTPGKVAPLKLEQLVQTKAPWILKQISAIEATRRVRKEFVSGESFPYLGQSYPLDVSLASVPKPQVRLAGNRLLVLLPKDLGQGQHKPDVRIALETWYLERAKAVLPVRVEAFSQLISKQPAKVSVRNPQHRWGSCSANGNINLNWRIVMAPSWVVDYVAAHEVCHLQVHNHSAAFWHLLDTVMPDYKAPREWLKVNGHRLAF
jgi:predicted metal-dependent hydrolase